VLGLSDTVRDLSPFTHLPAVPVEPARLAPELALVAVAAAFAAGGVAAFTGRDVGTV
jgi:ABC-2 type transport system permease protein